MDPLPLIIDQLQLVVDPRTKLSRQSEPASLPYRDLSWMLAALASHTGDRRKPREQAPDPTAEKIIPDPRRQRYSGWLSNRHPIAPP